MTSAAGLPTSRSWPRSDCCSCASSRSRWPDAQDIDPTRPAAVPIYLLAITLTVFVLNIPGNQLSRQVEASADQFALELTHDPKALVALQVELARANISDPDPPGWFAALFGTHPTTVQRIGAALASERGQP